MNRRRYMMNNKPYDAEVIFIRNYKAKKTNHDSAFIINELIDENTYFECSIMEDNTDYAGYSNFIFYVQSDMFMRSSGVCSYCGQYNMNVVLSAGQLYTFRIKRGQVIGLNGSPSSPSRTIVSTPYSTSISILTSGAQSQCRLYWFKIYRNNKLVRDLIPVRKNEYGCLYDKIKGDLFYDSAGRKLSYGLDINDPLLQ